MTWNPALWYYAEREFWHDPSDTRYTPGPGDLWLECRPLDQTWPPDRPPTLRGGGFACVLEAAPLPAGAGG
ncbi:MAG: hypothetical protein HC915_17065 [Anaerolineae bacterium]|nr:hypothetical protein [Anaerolineae bacterium]